MDHGEVSQPQKRCALHPVKGVEGNFNRAPRHDNMTYLQYTADYARQVRPASALR